MPSSCNALVDVSGLVLASGTVELYFIQLVVLTLIAAAILQWRLPSPAAGGCPRSAMLLVVARVVKTCLLTVLFLASAALLYGILTIDEREAYRRSHCRHNLMQIGLAMHNYHDQWKCFPPAYTTDQAGQPLHSWRVLLLPYLDEQRPEGLYEQLNLDEPWDSPANRKALDSVETPYAYRCPSDPETYGADSPRETSYAMLVGPGTVSNGSSWTTYKRISDGTSNTILVAEVTGLGIHWAEPRDLPFQKMSFRINDPDHQGIGSHHTGGAQMVFCDGAVMFIPNFTDPRLVQALATIAGGEDVSAVFERRRR
jgi:prepilin-type processing-associated H-X9-DG protein